MDWTSTHAGHGGRAATMFADGALGSRPDAGLILIDTLSDVSAPPDVAWQSRPAAQVVGWVATCNCGWRGRPWRRTTDPDDDSIESRVGYTPDTAYARPPEWLEELLHAEWLHGHELQVTDPSPEVLTRHEAIREGLERLRIELLRAEQASAAESTNDQRAAAYRAAGQHLGIAQSLIDNVDAKPMFDPS